LWKIWVVKTTLELPDDLLRRTKALAALRGVSMRDLIAQALEAELKPAGRGAGWRRLIGRARGLDTKPVQRAIDEEFSRVDKDSW